MLLIQYFVSFLEFNVLLLDLDVFSGLGDVDIEA
jgi:hypothetical protein